MPKLLPLIGALATALTAVIGTTITIDARYAKSAEVQEQFCKARKQALRDRIFEIDLKPDRSASDKALREYLSQQLNDPC
jgi:hypothetical protein